MGFPSPATDYVENRVSLDEVCTTYAAHVYLMRSASRSIREGIRKDALLVVNCTAKHIDGCILVMMVEGEFSLRRLRTGQPTRLEALDDPSDAIEVTEEMVLDSTNESGVCFGVVTHVLNTLKAL